METVTDLIFLGFKITADDDFSHEIKRHLLLGKKAMTNLDSILKSRAKEQDEATLAPLHYLLPGPPSQGFPDWEPSVLTDDPGGTPSPSHGWSVQDALVSMIFSSPSAEPSRVELGASLGLSAVPAE